MESFSGSLEKYRRAKSDKGSPEAAGKIRQEQIQEGTQITSVLFESMGFR